MVSFKPCYKWNAFNTMTQKCTQHFQMYVLNLVINGMPSILHPMDLRHLAHPLVLNLVINGMPSIRSWSNGASRRAKVLNFVINGMPSILKCIQLYLCLIWVF